ncbi:MAG: group III truncated hemoglobin [Sphingobacteriales bacterium]|nr:MAG: group III truncated hemoglobin [Sphingobacteriales bacterium]
MKADISTIQDIHRLVDTFYGKIQQDPVVGPVFTKVIGEDWSAHLDKMYRFWQTILLEEHTYNGRPFPPHAHLPVSGIHFDTWLRLWSETVDEGFEGPMATEAKWRADKMATVFLAKIEYFKHNSGTPLM